MSTAVGDIFDLAALRAAITGGAQPEYLFFWGHRARSQAPGKHVLSQWWPATFTIDGERYASAEHYMMAEKARLFGDDEIRASILAAQDPGKAKALGRQVRGFDAAAWDRACVAIVVRGNLAKFGQNAALASWLRATGDAVLVEASPLDAIWGIGLAVDDPRASDPHEWPGRNLLGFALMRVRAALARPQQG
jgi:ribA/ribD-fused uncharacterized protein